jgi:TetR/AcrR family transcriptional regulator, regulator of cefoperazone and chloramphenicol sensitivity
MLSGWKLCVKWNTLTAMHTEITLPRRRPQDGGYACGEETRARIVATALEVFGAQGYEKASTRRIAAEAGVNPPALQYYFGGKEGLHLACAQHIVERVLLILAPALARAATVVRRRQRERAADALCELLDALADGLMAVGSESWSRFIARGKADGGGPAITLIREKLGMPIMTATTQLVALGSGGSVKAEVTRVRACAILGQVSSLHANRENTLAALGRREFDAEVLTLIKGVIREHTRASLGCKPA